MPLSTGDRLGPYEIQALIGKGGMGEVYRARDPRLGREVAIKVSAERFSERFEREARVIASLNHPNICTLHDVGPNYLVMELVEGETLADRIAGGAMPLGEVLPIARQIAEALDTAHERGVVHRDLKPANVKIRPDGAVKVLDFGLAKTGGTQTVSSGDSPTLTMGQTQAGMILGTASYMAPEQARGRPVDKRADIYAFGAVLFEMLTGRRLHQGETITEVLASVMKEEPSWDQVPPQVRVLLRHCLEKDPQKRLRSAGDAMAFVETGTAAAAPSPGRTWLWPTVAAVLAIALAFASWNWWRATRPADLPLVREDVDVDSDAVLPAPVAYVSNVIISPQGTRLAYVASGGAGGPTRIFTRRLDQPKPTELAGTEGARGPFFSPDGQWIGFSEGGRLYKISVEGGAAVPLADLSAYGGASWGEDFIIVAQVLKPLARIPVSGGTPTSIMDLAPGEVVQVSPQILPGGKAVLFSANKQAGPDTATVEVVSLADRRRKTLVPGGAFPRYVPSVSAGANGSGHVLYTFKGALYAIPFDLRTLETHGIAVPLLGDVNTGPITVAAKFDVSNTGTLVYQKGGAGGLNGSNVQWVDSSGKQQVLLPKPASYVRPRLSPDGKRLAVGFSDGSNEQIEVYDWQADRTTQVTFGAGIRRDPVWSPDGQYVVFLSFNSAAAISWTRADGSGQPRPLSGTGIQIPGSFSPDGKFLAYADQLGSGGQIWTVPIESKDGQLKAGMPVQFLKDQFVDGEPEFSPDGKWMAYVSAESGNQSEVYVRPFPAPASGQGGKWLISTQGGDFPVWSRKGHELFYAAPGGQIMVVGYSTKGDTFEVDKARLWLANSAAATSVFDLAPDGKRIVGVLPILNSRAPRADHEVTFVENFFDELRRRVPAGK